MRVQANDIDRRQLLQGGVALFGGLALFGRSALSNALDRSRVTPCTLLLVELDGGNDGLATIVPWADDALQRMRRRTRIDARDVLAIDDHQGFHPKLRNLRDVYMSGRMAIIEGTGDPSPSRSHLVAQDVRHTARAAGRASGDGWIGRLVAATCAADRTTPHAIHVGSRLPHALRSSTHATACFDAPSFARRHAAIKSSIERDVSRCARGPAGKLDRDLAVASALIRSPFGCRVVSVRHAGYDTHEDQRPRHDRLMSELDRGLSSFLEDMRSAPSSDVIVLVTSEFGRAAGENASGGTDHGGAGPMFLLGSRVRGGLFGHRPALKDDGELAITTDFRSVYASVIEQGFGIDSEPILGARYAPIPGCIT